MGNNTKLRVSPVPAPSSSKDWMGSPWDRLRLDRLCHGQYASYIFPQENFVLKIQTNLFYIGILQPLDIHHCLSEALMSYLSMR